MHMNPKIITEVVSKVLEGLPPGFKNLPNDVQQNLRAALHGVFEKLDLVTREEFDAQCAVLLRTREKLEALENKINSEARTK